MHFHQYQQLAHHYGNGCITRYYKNSKWAALLWKLFCKPLLYTVALGSSALFVLFAVVILVQLFIAHSYHPYYTNPLDPSDVSDAPTDRHTWISSDDQLQRQKKLTDEGLRRQVLLLQQEIASLKRQRHKTCWNHHTGFLREPATFGNEYEVNPFSYFTFTRFYPSTLGLGKRVVEKPIGKRRKELSEIIGKGISTLNGLKVEQRNKVAGTTHGPPQQLLDTARPQITIKDFVEGITSRDELKGTYYHLYFRAGLGKNYHKLTFLRPLGEPLLVSNELVSTSKEVIHLIVPVNEERLDTLQYFLENLRRPGILNEIESKRLKIFVSYYGNLQRVTQLGLDKEPLVAAVIHISNVSATFSRARALQNGASIVCADSSPSSSGCLLFFCDVDLIFTAGFLERCRLHTARSKKVYYPIVFSLYNPKFSKIQWPMKDERRLHFDEAITEGMPLHKMINTESGWWRDVGYGMTCQYHSDFIDVGGFDEYLQMTEGPTLVMANVSHLNGTGHSDDQLGAAQSSTTSAPPLSTWGGEDTLLYRRHLQSQKLNVFRSIDPGIFHLYHEKNCERHHFHSKEQLHSCLSSKALNEASQTQLAMALAEHQQRLEELEQSINDQ